LAFHQYERIFAGNLIDVGEVIRGGFIELWSSVHDVIVKRRMAGGIASKVKLATVRRLPSVV